MLWPTRSRVVAPSGGRRDGTPPIPEICPPGEGTHVNRSLHEVEPTPQSHAEVVPRCESVVRFNKRCSYLRGEPKAVQRFCAVEVQEYFLIQRPCVAHLDKASVRGRIIDPGENVRCLLNGSQTPLDDVWPAKTWIGAATCRRAGGHPVTIRAVVIAAVVITQEMRADVYSSRKTVDPNLIGPCPVLRTAEVIRRESNRKQSIAPAIVLDLPGTVHSNTSVGLQRALLPPVECVDRTRAPTGVQRKRRASQPACRAGTRPEAACPARAPAGCIQHSARAAPAGRRLEQVWKV